jgi:hypothetical protein
LFDNGNGRVLSVRIHFLNISKFWQKIHNVISTNARAWTQYFLFGAELVMAACSTHHEPRHGRGGAIIVWSTRDHSMFVIRGNPDAAIKNKKQKKQKCTMSLIDPQPTSGVPLSRDRMCGRLAIDPMDVRYWG